MRIMFVSALLFLVVLPLDVAHALPDLTVTVEVTQGIFDPGDPLIDGDETIQMHFKVSFYNNGDMPCPAGWFADFWPDYNCEGCDPADGCGDHIVYEEDNVGILEPGAPPIVFEEIIPMSPNILEQHYLIFIDSVFDFCTESNENNNINCGPYSVSMTAGEADIAVTECSIEPSTEKQGNWVFTASVENVGNAATKGPVNVEFYLQSMGETYEDHEQQIGDAFVLLPGGIEPGETLVIQKDAPCSPATYEGACVANVFKEIVEPFYDNNVLHTESFTCLDMPDLAVTSFQAEMVGKTPVYTGLLQNLGNVDITEDEPFKIGLWYHKPGGPDLNTCPDVNGGEGWVIVMTDGLVVDEEAEFGYAASHFANGFYESWVVADCDGEISELDEKNNKDTADLLVELPGPDLLFKDASYEIYEEGKGICVDFNVWVENVGADPAIAPFYVDVFWDLDEPATCLGGGDSDGAYYKFEDDLEPEAVRLVTFSWCPVGGIPEGLYQTWLQLDICGDVPETNENNNDKVVDLDIPEFKDGCPNLHVEMFTAKVVGTNVNYYLKIGNNGDKDAKQEFRIDLFVDQEGQPVAGDYGDFHQVVEGLVVGEFVEFLPTWENLKDGEYRAYVIVDTQNTLEECVEADNTAGPRIVPICASCNACPEEVYVTDECVCGDETVNYGFCCSGEWFAVGCPDGGDVTEPDDIVTEVSSVEFSGNGFGEVDPDCACRSIGAPLNVRSGAILLILLAGLMLVLIRTRKRSF
jgi:hypothetical protein